MTTSEVKIESMDPSAMPPAVQPKPSLLTLPRELRNLIFYHLFTNQQIHLERPSISPWGESKGCHKPLHIAPLLVSKQFRSECIVEYLRHSRLYIDDETDLHWANRELRVLFTPAVQLCEHVRIIRLIIHWSKEALVYMQFLRTCTKLKELVLGLDAPLPATANLISWTFHLHLLKENVSGLEGFAMYSVQRPGHPPVRELQESIAKVVMAGRKHIQSLPESSS
jgi:hypothetical protein